MAITYTASVIHIDSSFSDVKFPEQVKQSVDEITIVKTAEIDKAKIFETMADIQNYPIILPQNVISVKILNQSNNIIYAEEELRETFVKTNVVVKHTVFPHEKYIAEVMTGDAEGTMITLTFEGENSTTVISGDVKLRLKGVLAPFVYFPKQSLEQYAATTLDKVIDYTIGFDTESKKAIDNLYREILYRPADRQGLEYYGSLVEGGKMTLDDVRTALFNSEERKSLLEPSEQKSIEELSTTTKKTIDDLYQEILYRPADNRGLQHFGSLLESGKMTIDDIRTALFNSEEKRLLLESSEQKTLDELSDQSKKAIDNLYIELLRRPADRQGLEYYGSLLESGKMTIDDIREILFNSNEAVNIRLSDPTKLELDKLYVEIFGKHMDQQTLDYYFEQIRTKKMTWEEVREDILAKKNP